MTPFQWLLGFIVASVFGWLAVEADRESRRRKRVSLNHGAEDFA